jgi:hypothetical protein
VVAAGRADVRTIASGPGERIGKLTTRCAGTNTLFATDVELPVVLPDVTYQSSMIENSAIGATAMASSGDPSGPSSIAAIKFQSAS